MKKLILVNRVIVLILCIAVLASISTISNTVNASGDEAGFYVSAQLPANQQDKNVSYFDLKMKPGKKQTIYVDIYNEKNESMHINIYAANASSNANGIIDYTKKGVADITLNHAFEDIAKPEEDVVTIPAGNKKTVGVQLSMPEDEYKGIILGGLVFTEAEKENEEQDKSSMSIDNTISYAMAVKLTEHNAPVEVDLSLAGVESKTVNHQPVIIHNIRNSEMAMSTHMSIKIDIVDSQSQKTVLTHEDSDLSIAPNSLMPYSLTLKDKSIEPGEYISKVTVKYNDKKKKLEELNFEKTFTVDKEFTKKVDKYNDTSSQMPVWAIVIIVFLAVLTVSIIILIILLVARKKNRGKNFNK